MLWWGEAVGLWVEIVTIVLGMVLGVPKTCSVAALQCWCSIDARAGAEMDAVGCAEEACPRRACVMVECR